tara:strand:- start:2004 stop:2960 length:957 start_codon:yes stop_codon:yes gene_type:complete
MNAEITEKIMKKRNVKSTTLNAYLLNLNKLLKLEDLTPSTENLDKLLTDSDNVMDLLNGKKPSTLRNYLASIVVYLSLHEKNDEIVKTYRALMDTYQKQNNDNLANNQKSEKQKENWTTIVELQKVLGNYKKQLDRDGSLKKDELNKKEFDLLQKWFVGSLYIGDESNPPLRNDYIMDIVGSKDYDRLDVETKQKNNYLVVKNKSNKMFSLGEYKTSEKYGVKLIKVGKKLNTILNVWLKYNKSKHLILNANGDQITPNSLTKLLIKIFEPSGKKISSSMLRSIYISEKFPPQNEAKTELADLMLHSKEIAGDVYAKK